MRNFIINNELISCNINIFIRWFKKVIYNKYLKNKLVK
jgi:hypothetical protein